MHRHWLIFPIYFHLNHSISYGCSLLYVIIYYITGWSRADLRFVYQFWGHLIWVPIFNEGRKRKTNILHKNEKLFSVILFSRLSIKSKHINTVNRTKNYHITLIFSCFDQYLDKKSRNKLCWVVNKAARSARILPLSANHGDTLGQPLTWHNSTNAQMKALDQPLKTPYQQPDY